MTASGQLRKIINFVCRDCGVTRSELLGKEKSAELKRARQLAARLLSHFGLSGSDAYAKLPSNCKTGVGLRLDNWLYPLPAPLPELEQKLRSETGFGIDDYVNYRLDSELMSLEDYVKCARLLGDDRFNMSAAIRYQRGDFEYRTMMLRQ